MVLTCLIQDLDEKITYMSAVENIMDHVDTILHSISRQQINISQQ